jgi:hypothetical protein
LLKAGVNVMLDVTDGVDELVRVAVKVRVGVVV